MQIKVVVQLNTIIVLTYSNSIIKYLSFNFHHFTIYKLMCFYSKLSHLHFIQF